MRNSLTVTVCLVWAIILLSALCVSADEETKWESQGPYGGLIWSIQVDSKDSKRLLAWTTGGSFLSTDTGSSWKRILPPEGADHIRRIDLIAGRFYCGHEDSIFVSDDGKTWKEEVNLGGHIWQLTHEPGKPDKLCCLFYNQLPSETSPICFARKMDGKWETHRIADIPDLPAGGFGTQFIISPADPSIIRIFIMLWGSGDKTLAYGSDDGGKTWKDWTISAHITSVAFSAAEAKTIYGVAWNDKGRIKGLIKSTDGGKDWKVLSDDKRISSLRTILPVPRTGEMLIGSTDCGLFKTRDYGKNLTEINNGLYNKNVSALAADPNDGNVLYAGTQWGLYKSIDGGKSWKWASEGIAGCQSTGLLTFPDDPDRIVVLEYHQGLRVSSDGGKTWSKCAESETLKGKPCDAWGVGDKTVLLLNTAQGYELFVSGDKGESWKSLGKLEKEDYPLAIASEKEMYGMRRGGYLTKSTGSVSWKVLTKPFPESREEIKRVLLPREKGCVLVIGEDEIIRCDSSNGKRLSIIKVPSNLHLLTYGAVLQPSDSQTLYLPDMKGDIYKHSLQTGQWTKLCSYNYGNKPFNNCHITFDPSDKKTIVAAYNNGHIVLSNDSGETWKALKPALPFFAIRHVAVTSNHKLVVSGNGTVYTLDLSKAK